MHRITPRLAILLSTAVFTVRAQYPGWPHSGDLTILTTPEGASLPAGASVEAVPLLVRLDREWFDFTQAKPGGADIRFSASDGAPLAYQVEEWDAAKGTAAIWVRIPKIEGNARQIIRMHWGKADAASESSGRAVFNDSNGYLSAWHLGDTVADEAGTLTSKDTGTTLTDGIIGKSRHFTEGRGIFGGDKIPDYPTGPGPYSSEAWFRAEKPNATVLGWGNEQAQGKVVMQFQSPPHIRMDCYFSGANVESTGRMPMGEWVHVIHTCQKGDSRLYVNGVLSGASTRQDSPLAIKSPARLWIGGWYHHYDFDGAIDEVRISKVVRSPEWVRLQYENQKALQSLVGHVIQPGTAFSASPAAATVLEGKTASFTGAAGGAQKILWLLRRDGQETVVATDRFTCTLTAGRVTGDQAATLVFKAVYPGETKTKEIPVTIKEDIPEPVFSLKAPAAWDGRTAIEVVPQIENLTAMQAKGAGEVKITWKVADIATVKEVAPGKLLLKRAQNSGRMVVSATVSNGGRPATQSVTIAVTEPKAELWVVRTPGKDEKPVDGQFYARDDHNEGTLHYNGTLTEPADTVFLRVRADDNTSKTVTATPAADMSYALSAKLQPGLIKYTAEFGTLTSGQETVLQTVRNLVCGDAWIITGQSNALATDTGEKSPPETNEWIRSYGLPPRNTQDPPGNLWCNPVWKSENGEKAELGWWGMELAKRLYQSHRMPVCIINGAVGGTRIDQHQRNHANPADLSTIYGRTL